MRSVKDKWYEHKNSDDNKFDRFTFDPVNNYEDRTGLTNLRKVGKSRCEYMAMSLQRNNTHTHRNAVSTALGALPIVDCTDKVLIDAGCGNSADADYFTRSGGKGIGYDLFPRSEYLYKSNYFKQQIKWESEFYIQDIAEAWPNSDDSVDYIVSQAVLDLLQFEDRKNFYKESYRVLRTGGILSVLFIPLKLGWGYSPREEIASMKEAGLVSVGSEVGTNLFLFKKPNQFPLVGSKIN